MFWVDPVGGISSYRQMLSPGKRQKNKYKILESIYITLTVVKTF